MKIISNVKVFGGQQIQFKHTAKSVGCDMTASVFLPPQAQTQKVPVVIWLSGLTCTDQNFVTKAGAQRMAAKLGMAIVAPDTSPRGDNVPDDPNGAWDFGLGAGFYVNATQAPWSENYQMMDYITQDLPEIIGENYNVDLERCGISGHSMGGHGALTIALKNPHQYRSASAFSPIVSPMNCPWGQKALGNYIGDDKEQWKQYDTCALVQNTETRMPILVDQGTSDDFLMDQLKTELLEQSSHDAQYPMTIRYQQGYDHSYFFVATFIDEHLTFHAQNLIVD